MDCLDSFEGSPNRLVNPRRRLRDGTAASTWSTTPVAGSNIGDSVNRGAGPSNERGAGPSNQRDTGNEGRMEEIDDEPLIILDAAEKPQDLEIGRPLDLRREIVPGESIIDFLIYGSLPFINAS